MSDGLIRTRYAPSPTGMMHIGNLRTALYEYLIAKSKGGKFILRIEDTDQERKVENAIEMIYHTLDLVGLQYDEGPNIGGDYGPYVQSQCLDRYQSFARKLVEEGKAYYCFCSKERLQKLQEDAEKKGEFCGGYDRHCRTLSAEKVQELLKQGTPYVIRQKVPTQGRTTFQDEVYGTITVENCELEDQILIKTDGYPTYNFANVIDDHEMHITHVVRGCEYLSSTPKYNLLYEAFGWEIPIYIHLPLIMGKNPDGTTSKLSKRHGATGFYDLIQEGYLPEAIVNYIVLLGWCPSSERELFSLEDLVAEFSISRISKSPAIFDYDKLSWFNAEYIRKKSLLEFANLISPYCKQVLTRSLDLNKIAAMLQPRVVILQQIPEMICFLEEVGEYDLELFVNKKSKTTIENSRLILKEGSSLLATLENWTHDAIYFALSQLAVSLGVKNGTVMWPIRIAISGKSVTPGGAIEILDILGKQESLERINRALDKLERYCVEE